MAIIDLGKVSITWRGAYDGSTAYTPKDAVVYNNASYICTANTTGNLPTDTSYWNVMAAKGVDGTDLTTTLTTQGDIVYRDGSGLQRLAAGTSGQALITGGSGANPSWGSAGGVLQVKTANITSVQSFGSSGGMVSGVAVSITPSNANNKILIMAQATGGSSGTTTGNIQLRRATGSSVATSDTVIGGGASAGSRAQAIGWMGTYYQHWNATNLGFHFLDNPNTTSQITYGLMMGSHDGGTYYLGRTGRDDDDANHGRFPTNLTLMEIDSGVL